MLEVSEVRKRLLQTIERARQGAAARRRHADEAQRHYEPFLEGVAGPVFKLFALALNAEGLPFKVFTPAGSVRLASEKSGDDFIELALDAEHDPPQVLGRASRGRGRRVTASERPVQEGAKVQDLTDEDVLQFLLREIGPFIER
ncbi:MAG: hypothetical protein LC804_10930 [Acidobacteria bacterium]|nr:hypothetical protein [Acidobacteriota bacterium]